MELDEVLEEMVRSAAFNAMHIQCRKLVRTYLEEKGVEYRDAPHPRENDEVKSWVVELVDVPVRLYHQVVVPGIIELCKANQIAFQPYHYLQTDMGRTITLVFSVRRMK